MELIGLPLAVALEMLPETPLISETAPPRAPKHLQTWGELRVLRVVQGPQRLELLVARELLGEE